MSQFPQVQTNGTSVPPLPSYGATSLPSAPSYGYAPSTSTNYPNPASYSSADYRFHPYAAYGQTSAASLLSGATQTNGTIPPPPSTTSSTTIPPQGFGYGSVMPPPPTSNRYDTPYQSSTTSFNRYDRTPHSHSTSSLFAHRDISSRPNPPRPKALKNEFGMTYGQPGAGLRRIDWSKEDLSPFRKNFYREHSAVSKMTDSEVKQWREENSICVIGSNIPKPIRTFEQTGFPEYIMAEIRRAGFENPTPIQAQGWPMAMSGRDVVGIAKTGSGKTLAFILPSIVHINAQPLLRKGDGPIVLVVAPTRELAVQIEAETRKFAYSSKIKHTCVYGGIPRREQAKILQEGVEICICTPGRLLDFLETGVTNLSRVTYLVIDEADRLLDMGFEPQLKALFSQVRPDRQVLMWSATWPKEVRQLAAEFMSSADTIQVSVGSWDTKANHDVTQIIEVLSPYDKTARLSKMLRSLMPSGSMDTKKAKILIFTATRRGCNDVVRTLLRDGWPVTAMHGEKEQNDRDRALEDFKSGRCLIMVATDVASRGIHVEDISHVINYDFPLNIEDYVHRIGRTGRVGKKGTAISFFTRDDAKRTARLIAILEEAKQTVPKELRDMLSSGGGSSSGGNYYDGASRYRQSETNGSTRYGESARYSESAYDLRETRSGGGGSSRSYDRDDKDRHRSSRY